MRFPISQTLRNAIAFLLVTCAAVPALAQPPSQVLIHAAAANATLTVVFVEGKNFSSNTAVYLGGVPLGGVAVNPTGTVLTATITGTLPGSMHLQTGTILNLHATTALDVRAGTTAKLRAPGVEVMADGSTIIKSGSNVDILAGGNADLRAGGTVDIRGSLVNIN